MANKFNDRQIDQLQSIFSAGVEICRIIMNALVAGRLSTDRRNDLRNHARRVLDQVDRLGDTLGRD